MSLQPKLIKKYRNRSLYDTEKKCYITLQDIKQMVMGYQPVEVIDADGNDVTNTVFLQIISESEGKDAPLFTRTALECLIRSYGCADQMHLRQLIEANLQFIANGQAQLAKWFPNPGSWQPTAADNPLAMWESSMQAWKNMWQPSSAADSPDEKEPSK